MSARRRKVRRDGGPLGLLRVFPRWSYGDGVSVVAPIAVDDSESVPSFARDLLSLTKPSLSSLVLLTTAGGMFLAPGRMSFARALISILASAGTVGAANALNCYWERDSDRFMRRTAVRPLPAGRMEPRVALGFGLALLFVSVPALAFSANLLTAGLGLLAFLSYVFAYTPLKAKSHYAMLVGAIPGALPPLMGWTAVENSVNAPGMLLFWVLFFWQLPHFLAIALFRKQEYAAAGLHSVPLARGDEVARWQAFLYALPLIPCTLGLYLVGVAGPIYLAAAAVLSTGFVGYAAYGAFRAEGPLWARRFFLSSLLYLTALFAALWIDARPY